MVTTDQPYDLTGDGQVSISDLSLFALEFGTAQQALNDPLVTHPRAISYRHLDAVTPMAVTPLCEFGHQGLTHDEEFDLIYNRARTLYPRLGRFVQRDPAGYVDGMSLFNTLSTNHSSHLDPSGLDAIIAPSTKFAKAYTRSAIFNYRRNHSSSIAYKAFGLEKTVIFALRTLNREGFLGEFYDINNPLYIRSTWYRPGTLWIPTRGATNEEIMHEAWHAHVDIENTSINTLDDEGIGYAIQYAHGGALDRFERLEEKLANKIDRQSAKRIYDIWVRGWTAYSKRVIGGYAQANHKQFLVSEAHLQRAESSVGFNISCSRLAEDFNALPNVSNSCIRFSCNPLGLINESDGIINIRPGQALPPVLVD